MLFKQSINSKFNLKDFKICRVGPINRSMKTKFKKSETYLMLLQSKYFYQYSVKINILSEIGLCTVFPVCWAKSVLEMNTEHTGCPTET